MSKHLIDGCSLVPPWTGSGTGGPSPTATSSSHRVLLDASSRQVGSDRLTVSRRWRGMARSEFGSGRTG